MKTSNRVLASCVLATLAGCSAGKKYKDPNYVLGQESQNRVERLSFGKSMPNSAGYLENSCTQANSVHNPIMWLPIIGPSIDLLMIPNASKLTGADYSAFIPLVGPAYTYAQGSTECMYRGVHIYSDVLPGSNSRAEIPLNANIPDDAIREIISISDKNCAAYGHMMQTGFSNIDVDQRIFNDWSDLVQTGAAYASPVAAPLIIMMKKTLSSSNDAIKDHFFTKIGLDRLFDNVAAVRGLLLNDLCPPSDEADEPDAAGGAAGKTPPNACKKSRWGYVPGRGMSYGRLREFMKVYDKSCHLEQALSDLRLALDKGQADLKSAGDAR